MTARRRNPNRKATPGQAALIVDLNKRLGRNPSPAWYYETLTFHHASSIIDDLKMKIDALDEVEEAEREEDCEFQDEFLRMLENDQDFKRRVKMALGIEANND